jgi:ABC-type multidrug transport system permease subunit
MAALFPNATMAGFANALFWMILVMFNGGPIPHSAMNGFYKPWLFWADPLRYYLGGTVATVLNAVQAQCNEGDLAVFDPVPGLTCIEYASVYMESSPGYLVNPTATTSCEYCQYSTGKDYSSTLDYHYSERWWYWAVFLAFALCNILLLFLVTALMRVKLRLWKKKFHDRYSKAH